LTIGGVQERQHSAILQTVGDFNARSGTLSRLNQSKRVAQRFGQVMN
jgi:endonuclease/exonuclease/phosphatase (EEP) superfamily protein YafD